MISHQFDRKSYQSILGISMVQSLQHLVQYRSPIATIVISGFWFEYLPSLIGFSSKSTPHRCFGYILGLIIFSLTHFTLISSLDNGGWGIRTSTLVPWGIWQSHLPLYYLCEPCTCGHDHSIRTHQCTMRTSSLVWNYVFFVRINAKFIINCFIFCLVCRFLLLK